MEDKVVKSSNAIDTTERLSFASMEAMEAWGDRVVKSGFTPLKTGSQVVSAVLLGRELGLGDMVSVNNIYPINGKATAGVHIINALLQKAGIIVEVVRNYEPCIRFGFKDKDGGFVKDKDGNPILLKIDFVDVTPKDNEVKGTTIVDYKTVVKFTRQLKQPNGSFKEIIHHSSYSWSEASQAGLLEKDNWKKYAKQMTLNRAIAFGGRFIAADIMFNLYETNELTFEPVIQEPTVVPVTSVEYTTIEAEVVSESNNNITNTATSNDVDESVAEKINN